MRWRGNGGRGPSDRFWRFAWLFLLALGSQSPAAPSLAQEIWFQPHSPQPKMNGPDDWDALFGPNAPWPNVAKHTAAFGFDIGYIDHTPDTILKDRIDELKRRNIAVKVTLQALAFNDDPCGHGVEGYYDRRQVARDAEKLLRVGASVKYIALDGPLDFGHYYDGPNACRSSIEEVIQRVMFNLESFLRAFPEGEIVDVLSTSVVSRPTFQADYLVWKHGLEARMGRKLSHLLLDVGWPHQTWQRDVVVLRDLARRENMRFGIIYNGDGRDTNDREWVAHAMRNYQVIESQLDVIPDFAAFGGWNDYPKHILPETADTSMTYVIAQYLLPRTKIRVGPTGASVTGSLMDAAGRPVAGAPIQVAWGGVDPARPLPVHTTVGKVPSAARNAILALRFNNECPCQPAANDFRVGALTYTETDGGNITQVANYASQLRDSRDPASPDIQTTVERRGSETVVHVVTDAQKRMMFNSRPFAVTPGARFTFSVALGTTFARPAAGYAAIIWLGGNGERIERTAIFDQGDYAPAGSATTGPDGRFTMTHPPDAAGRPAPLRLTYPGTGALRPAFAETP